MCWAMQLWLHTDVTSKCKTERQMWCFQTAVCFSGICLCLLKKMELIVVWEKEIEKQNLLPFNKRSKKFCLWHLWKTRFNPLNWQIGAALKASKQKYILMFPQGSDPMPKVGSCCKFCKTWGFKLKMLDVPDTSNTRHTSSSSRGWLH